MEDLFNKFVLPKMKYLRESHGSYNVTLTLLVNGWSSFGKSLTLFGNKDLPGILHHAVDYIKGNFDKDVTNNLHGGYV